MRRNLPDTPIDIVDGTPLGRYRLGENVLHRPLVHAAGQGVPVRDDGRATHAVARERMPQEIVADVAEFDWASPLPGNPSPPAEERDFFCCPGNIERFVAEGATDA